MKKICLSLVAASAILFSTQTASAQTAVQEEVTVEQTADQQTEFTQVAIEDLPAAVQQAVERDFAGAVIAEAYVKETEASQEFKLVVQTAEGEQKELYADAEGNWIDKE
jgi:hypothetical protein